VASAHENATKQRPRRTPKQSAHVDQGDSGRVNQAKTDGKTDTGADDGWNGPMPDFLGFGFGT
jgi:hypothetical protein